MPKMSTKGLDDAIAMLSKVGSKSRDIIERGLYEGAGVVADAVRENIDDIPTSEDWGTPNHPKAGPSAKEKDALREGLGVSPMETSGGTTNVSVGFDGYSDDVTKNFPKGKPVAMIARSVERGTSFMQARQFIKPAVASSKSQAIAKMDQTIKEEIKKLTK